MVPNHGSRPPKSRVPASNLAFAGAISKSLYSELGNTPIAAKTVMAWTGVSNHTARSWLNGQSAPDGLHLIALAARSRTIMTMVLYMAGHDTMALGFELEAAETALEAALLTVRELRRGR
jgi:hypothetical protein